MKILFLTHYYPPENGGPAFRMSGLASQLAQRGHEVTVVTGMPNYPKRKIFEAYQGRYYHQETIDGVTVIRLIFYVPERDSFLKRITSYITSMLGEAIGGLLVKKTDVVIATSPPLFSGLAGWFVSRLKRCPLVFDVRDIWPESAVALGVLQNPHAIRLSEWIEDFSYRKAKAVVGVTRGFIDYFHRKGVPPDKTFWISNGVDYNSILPVPYDFHLAEQYNWQDKFVVMYTGNIGVAQGLEVIYQAAEKLHDQKDIQFVFIGEGVKKQDLMILHDQKKLPNVLILPGQPKDMIPRFISVAACCVIPLKEMDLFKITIPSKLYEAMALNCPIVLGVDGNAREILEEANAGTFYQPDDHDQLVKVILELYKHPDRLNEMRQNGRPYVEKHFSREYLAQKLETVLVEVMKAK